MKHDSIYVTNQPLSEAKKSWHDALVDVGFFSKNCTTRINVDDALGKITAQPVFATHSSPSYNASAMDGVAVNFQDLVGASEATPIDLEPENFHPVNTGNAVPEMYNAVVMIEDVHWLDRRC